MFALMAGRLVLTAVFLMGNVTIEARKVLTYDFVTKHPSGETSFQGRKYYEDGFALWGGTWSGFFGKRIAFDMNFSSEVYLLGTGGLTIRQDGQLIYIRNLESADRITITLQGNNAMLRVHSNTSCSISGMSVGASVASGTTYTVQGAGDLCLTNSYDESGTETIINRITIETRDDVGFNVEHGMATVSCTQPLDFSNVDAKAYIATGFEDGRFNFTRIYYVPENTGVLVVTENGAKNISVPVGRGPSVTDNLVPNEELFVATVKNTSVSIQSGYSYYMVGRAGGNTGIFKASRSFTSKAGHAYLKVRN